MVAAKAMADSRVAATVSFHQHGYAGQKATLDVKDGDKLLATKDMTLDGTAWTRAKRMFFNAGDAGVKSIAFALQPLPGEENIANNAVTRLVNVSAEPRRILYVEGEPRWEFKFIRRAEAEDKACRSSPCCAPRRTRSTGRELPIRANWPTDFQRRAEDLFKYQAIILGSVEADYFTPVQQELLREFVDKRGGGLLFLGGRFALGDGGWASSSIADLFPTFLPNQKGTFHRESATVQLTAAGAESPITRLLDDPRGEYRSLAQAAVPQRLPGPGRAQARSDGAGADDGRVAPCPCSSPRAMATARPPCWRPRVRGAGR